MKAERFEDLVVWQRAHSLVLDVYRMTKGFPPDERFGLVSQIRRAAVSVAANIAEGFKRRGSGDKARFYNMAQASLEELRYYFILCRDLGYTIDYPPLAEKADHTARMLTSLVNCVQR